jgi:uncharacterized protein
MSTFPLHYTALYAGLLGVMFVLLSVNVSRLRGQLKITFLDGGNDGLLRAMRAQQNFAEYVPMFLLLIGLLEWSGQPVWVINALGIVLLVGRLVHAYGVIGSHQIVHAAGATVDYLVGGVSALLLLYVTLM